MGGQCGCVGGVRQSTGHHRPIAMPPSRGWRRSGRAFRLAADQGAVRSARRHCSSGSCWRMERIPHAPDCARHSGWPRRDEHLPARRRKSDLARDARYSRFCAGYKRHRRCGIAKGLAQGRLGGGDGDVVYVVRHQAVSQHRESAMLGIQAQPGEVGKVILLGKEDLRPVIPPLGHMMGHPGHHYPCETSHEVSMLTVSRVVKRVRV